MNGDYYIIGGRHNGKQLLVIDELIKEFPKVHTNIILTNRHKPNGQRITRGIMSIMLSKSDIIERTNPMNAKDERYIDKVSKLINNAKEESRMQGINEGLSLYPMLLDILISLRDIEPLEPSFNQAFGDYKTTEILRVHSINYIVSTLKFWNSLYSQHLSDEQVEKIDNILEIVEH